MRIIIGGVVATFLMLTSAAAAVGVPITAARHIPFALAREAAQAALDACRADKNPVVVQVYEPTGELKVALVDDGVRSYAAFEHARRKAYTTLTTEKPSSEFTDRVLPNGTPEEAQTNSFFARPLPFTELYGGPGALPIKHGDTLVGVISVDGRWDNAADGEDWLGDERCAQAGIDKIKDRL